MAISTRNVNRGFSLVELVIADLAVLRSAIDLYVTEHVGLLPTEAGFVSQMLQYSDSQGNTNAIRGGAFNYGPFLRAIPPLPLNGESAPAGKRGDTGVAGSPAPGIAWVYDESEGSIRADTGPAKDAGGKEYQDY